MIRLFTALSLPQDVRVRLGLLAGGIRGARWVAEDSFHITLRFIGNVAENRLDDIVESLRDVGNPALSIQLSGAGHFGGKKPRAVWIGVRKSEALMALHDKIDRRLVSCGLQPDGRKYAPHVTIARLGNPSRADVQSWIEHNGTFGTPPFTASSFILYQSHLGKSGPVYAPVSEFSLESQ